jgi:hypothetical protein
MRLRKIAQTIVTLRKLNMEGYLDRLTDRDDSNPRAAFVALALTLPNSVQASGGLVRRVILPVYRKIMREGILSQTFRRK